MPIARHLIRQPGKVGAWQQHQGVERVAVEAEGVLDVAVVGGVLRRGEEHPVQAHPAALVVDLVLVALTLGDLDQYVELQHVHPPPLSCRWFRPPQSRAQLRQTRSREGVRSWPGVTQRTVAGAAGATIVVLVVLLVLAVWRCRHLALDRRSTTSTSLRGSTTGSATSQRSRRPTRSTVAPPPEPRAARGRAAGAAAETVVDRRPLSAAEVRAALAPYLKDRDLGRHVVAAVAPLAAGAPAYVSGSRPRDPGLHDQAGDLDRGAARSRCGAHASRPRWSPAVPRRVVLVGGGDPFLMAEPPDDETPYPHRADVVTLAKQTAAALKDAGQAPGLGGLRRHPVHRPVRQPHLGEGLRPRRRGLTDHRALGRRGPVADRLRAGAGPGADRRHRLRRRAVAGPASRSSARPSAASPTAAGAKLASVESAPLSQIVERILEVSDNEASEVLLRHVGAADGRRRRRSTADSAASSRCWASTASGSAPACSTTAAGSRAPTGSPRAP